MDKERLNCYIRPDTKSKLKFFALKKNVNISKCIDDMINAFIEADTDTDAYPLGGYREDENV